jgi:transposase
MNILAMDLAKSNTVVCFYDSEKSKGVYRKIKTLPQQIHDTIVECGPDRVVFEICSIAGWVYDIASVLVNEVEVADVNGQAWRWKNVKSKTDRKDALKLAQLSSMGQLNCVHIPKKKVRQKRSLITFRQSLVGRRTQIKNSIHSILDKEGLGHVLPKGKKGWTKHSIKILSNMSKKLEDCSEDSTWRGQLHIELAELERVGEKIAETEAKLDKLAKDDKHIRVLRTIKGVGPRLSEAVAAFLDEPKRFSSCKQVGSYAGLTPKQYQSGSIDRQGRISGQGNKLLRSLLVEVSWLGLRNNKWMRETYHRILRGSASRKKIAITAVARKLLVRCWAMMRDGTEWREVEQTKDAA